VSAIMLAMVGALRAAIARERNAPRAVSRFLREICMRLAYFLVCRSAVLTGSTVVREGACDCSDSIRARITWAI